MNKEATSLATGCYTKPHKPRDWARDQGLVSFPEQGRWLVTTPRTQARGSPGSEPLCADSEASAALSSSKLA